MGAYNQCAADEKVASDPGTATSRAEDGIDSRVDRPSAKENARDFAVIIFGFLLIVAAIWYFVHLINLPVAVPIVRLAVDSYEGLPRNESSLVFSPEFNLTMNGEIGPRSEGIYKKLCYSQGSIKLQYQGVGFASGYIAGSCLDDTNRHAAPLFAWGKDVQMPLYLENNLRDEVKNGTAVLLTSVVLLVKCTDADSPYCGRCSFSCQPLIGHKEFSECQLLNCQQYYKSNSLE